jgi:hypothetical protein
LNSKRIHVLKIRVGHWDRKKGEKRGALEWAKKEVIAKMAGTALAGISVAQWRLGVCAFLEIRIKNIVFFTCTAERSEKPGSCKRR